MPQIVMYKDKAGEYRWTKFADNYQVTADSSEGYKSKSAIDKAANEEAQEGDEVRWAKDTELHYVSTQNPSDSDPHPPPEPPPAEV